MIVVRLEWKWCPVSQRMAWHLTGPPMPGGSPVYPPVYMGFTQEVARAALGRWNAERGAHGFPLLVVREG